MTEKRFRYYEHKGADYILDNPNTELDFIEMLGDCLEAEEIVDLLNKKDKIIKEKEKLIRAKNQQLDDVKRILYKFQDYDHDLIESILNELGWD